MSRRDRLCFLLRCCLKRDMGVASGSEGRHRMGGVDAEGAMIDCGWEATTQTSVQQPIAIVCK